MLGQTTAMVDVLTWGLLVPMLAANPDPVKVAHAHKMFYNFFSYNTAWPLLQNVIDVSPLFPHACMLHMTVPCSLSASLKQSYIHEFITEVTS